MITIAIWGDGKMLGLRCAKIKYGCDLVDDVLCGYCYQGNNGRLLVRVSEGEIPEDDICEGHKKDGSKCDCPLYICNASEVTV